MKKYQAKHGTVKSNTSLFFSGVVILTAANLIVKIIGLLFKIPMANTFGDEVMGYYNSAYAIYTFFYMISTAGLPVAVSIMIAESRAKGKLRQIKRIFTVTVGLFFLIGLAGMAMMFFGSGWYSADVLKAEPTKYSIMVIAPMLFLICISSAIRGYFQGFQQMMPTAVSELIEAFCKLAVGIALAAYAADRYPGQYHIIAAYAAIGLTVGAGLSMIFLVVSKLLFNESRYTKEFLDNCGGENTDSDPSGKIIKRLITIALPITISSSIMSLTGMIDSILVQRLLQQGSLITKAMTQKEATTVYGNYTSRAVPMFNLPPVLVYPISCSIVPLISAARGQGDTKRVGTIMESSLRTAVLIGAPCALGMTVLARPILSLFFTGAEAIDNAAPLLRLLAPSTFFVCILAVLTAMLQSCGKERLPLVSMCIGAVVKIIGSFVFIRLIGIYGAPVSTFFCYITICSIHLFFVRKHTGLTIKTGTVFVRPIFCAVLCAAAAYGAYFVSSSVLSARLATVVSIAAAIIVYVAAIFLFGAVGEDDIMLLPKGTKLCGILKKMKLLRK